MNATATLEAGFPRSSSVSRLKSTEGGSWITALRESKKPVQAAWMGIEWPMRMI